MRRRQFITLLGGAVISWPLASRAQQGERMRSIGVLTPLPADLPDAQERHAVFLQTLRQLGWTEGACASRFAGVLAIPTDFRKYPVELNALAFPGQIRRLHYWDLKWILLGDGSYRNRVTRAPCTSVPVPHYGTL